MQTNSHTTSDFFNDQSSTSSAKNKRLILNQIRNAWNQARISSDHQTIVEEYLNQLSYHLLESEAEYEIEFTLCHKSFLITISQLSDSRQSCLKDLHLKVLNFDSCNFRTESQMSEICTLMSKLRQINLVYAQTLLNIHNYFNKHIGNEIPCNKILQLFQQIQDDNDFLAKSLLRKYIVFSKTYDPFFLKHYQLLKNTNSQRLKELQSIQDLFDISVNQVFRMDKAQKQIVKYLQKKQVPLVERKSELTRKRYMSNFENNKFSERQPIKEEHLSSINSQFDKRVYLNHKTLLKTNKDPHSDKETAMVTQSSKISQPEHFFRISSPKKKPMNLIFPQINSIRSDKSIEQEVASKQEIKKRKIDTSPEHKKKELQKSITMVKSQQEQFKKYVFSKRFHTTRQQSLSPNPRVRSLTLEDRQITPEGSLLQNNLKTISIGSQITQELMEQPHQQSNLKSKIRKKKTQYQNQLADKKPAKDLVNEPQEQDIKRKPEIRANSDQNTKNQSKLKQPEKKVRFKGQNSEELKNSHDTKQKNDESAMKKTEMQKKKKETDEIDKRYRLKTSEKPETVESIMIKLQNYQIKSEYREKCEYGNWKKGISSNQYYFHKSYINDQLLAVSLCCALPEGDIIIKYWGPLKNCDEEISNVLFAHYLEHLEKNTLLKHIYFNGIFLKELSLNNFIIQKERIYCRNRVNSSSVEPFGCIYFLDVQFSNVAIPKTIEQQEKLIIQEDVQCFDSNKFVIFNYLLIINKLMTPGIYSQIALYNSNISLPKVTQTLLSSYLPTEAYNPQFKCPTFNLLALKFQTPVFSALFAADKGLILFLSGQTCYQNKESIIVCLPMYKYSTRMYFGKGFSSTLSMVEAFKQCPKKGSEKIQFSVRMFKKRLRGRLHCINLKNQNCYGDLEVNFLWKDYLQGKIIHDMTNCYQTFDQKFYCLIQLDKEIICAFEVLPQNFIQPQ